MDDQLSRPGTDRRAKGALASSSVVYFCRTVGAISETWERVTSHESLAAIQADASQYELLTLFTVPVDDVARAPVSTVARARAELDLIERRTASIELRVNDRLPDQKIHFEGELGVLEMKAGANELQAAVERAQSASLKFIHVRTDEAAQVIGYIKYLADLAGKAQASKSCAPAAAPQAGAGNVEVPEELREFIEAVANDYKGCDNQERLLCYGCNADIDDNEPHEAHCIVLRARAFLASPAAPVPEEGQTPVTGEGQQQDEPVAHLYEWIGDENRGTRKKGDTIARTPSELMGNIDPHPDVWKRISPLYTRVSLSSPAERQEAEALRRKFVSIITGATSLGEQRVYDLAAALVAESTARLAAPSSPSVEIGTVDTPELARLMRIWFDAQDGEAEQYARRSIVAHINQYAAQVAKAEREKALEDATSVVQKCFVSIGQPDDPHPDAVTFNGAVYDCTNAIKALRTPQPAADTEQGAK